MPRPDPTPPTKFAANALDPSLLQIVGGPRCSIIDMTTSVPIVIVPPGVMDPRYWNIVRSVSVAHVALQTQLEIIGRLVEMAERLKLDELTPPLLQAQVAATIARRVALIGIENITMNPEGK